MSVGRIHSRASQWASQGFSRPALHCNFFLCPIWFPSFFHRCWFLTNISPPGLLLSICFWSTQPATPLSPGYATLTPSWQPPCPQFLFIPHLPTLILGLSSRPPIQGRLSFPTLTPSHPLHPRLQLSKLWSSCLPSQQCSTAEEKPRTTGQSPYRPLPIDPNPYWGLRSHGISQVPGAGQAVACKCVGARVPYPGRL